MNAEFELVQRFVIGAVSSAAFSPDGATLATIRGSSITVWDVRTGAQTATAKSLAHLSSVDFSPTRRQLVVKNTDGEVAVHGLDDLVEQFRAAGSAYGEGTSIKYSPCGDYLIDGSWRGDLLVREADSGRVVLHEQGTGITCLACTPDRMYWIYVGSRRACTSRAWPFAVHDAVVFENGSQLAEVRDIAIASSGNRIVTAMRSLVATWEIDGRWLRPLAQRQVTRSGTGQSVAWHPGDASVAYAGGGQAQLLSADLTLLCGADFEYASAVAYSPDGAQLAVGDWQNGAVVALPPLRGAT